MRVLLFSNLFPIPLDPTRGVYIAQLANAIQQRALVHMLVPIPWVPASRHLTSFLPVHARQFQGLPRTLRWGNVTATVVRYPMVPGMGRGRQATAIEFAARAEAVRLHRLHHFDLLNAHWLDPDGSAAIAIGKTLGVPVVLSARGSDVHTSLAMPTERTRVLHAVRAADAITTVSEELKRSLVAAGIQDRHITAIPNGVDVTLFRPRDRAAARTSLSLPVAPEQRVILCVSRLSEEKGVDCLVEAMAEPALASKRATLVVVGDGPLRGALRQRAEQLGVQDAIHFVGSVDHPAVATWFAAADVCCLPSHREGCPNVILEALACGRPVVATAVGPVPHMLKSASGVVIPPGDPHAMATALAQALDRPWDPEEIAATVSRQDWGQAAEAYLALYQRVLGDR